MKIFIAGATGTLGIPVVQRLVSDGHEVIGLTRSTVGRDKLTMLGARGVVGNALDAEAMLRIVGEAAPTHVVHLLTALPKDGPTKASEVEATNDLRIRGTANLLRAAIAAGAKRIVAESFAMVYGVGAVSSKPVVEDAPLPALPDSATRDAIVALRSLETQLVGARDRIETIVLRYGYFYGPNVPSTEAMVAGLRSRKLPVMRGAVGIGSFIHIEDAAAATVAALTRGTSGSIYNIVDDAPVRFTDFVQTLVATSGAPTPRVFPRFLVKLAAPMAAEFFMTQLPLSNAKARRELAFAPRFPTYREGLTTVTGRGDSPTRTVASSLLESAPRR